MSDNLDIPILDGNDAHIKKPAVLPYFQASTTISSSQNEKWKKFFNISFIFCIIIVFVFSLIGVHERDSYNLYNNNSCSSLINNGHWISSPSKNNSFWQPETCVIKRYRYDINSVQTCLKNTNINFIGDITISRFFQSVESIAFGSITSNDDIKEKKTIERKQDSTRLAYHQDNYFDSEFFNQLLSKNNDPKIRNIYVVSSGKTLINACIDSDTNEINEAEFKEKKAKWSEQFLKALVKFQRTNGEYFIRLLTPVFNIAEDQPLAKKIVEWNNYITQVTEDIRDKDINGEGKIHVPFSWNKLYYDSISDYNEENRDIFIKNIVREELNLFLNSICNERVNITDSTCCVNYHKTHLKQDIIMLLLFIFGPLSLFYRKFIQKYYLLPPVINKFIPDDSLALHLTALALTVFFSHITDNTALFLKENKQYSLFKYLGLFAIVALPIIQTIETSKNTTSILNSEQVKEWQGLCVIMYLIIQYCSDSYSSQISHNISRVIVSLFMFLIGFTNYDYYYRKGNFEIINFIYFILKKAALPLVLAFALDGNMLDYFFPIMTIFWSIVIYSTMGILASYNNQKKFFLIKIGSAIGITYFVFVLLPFITKYLFLLLGILLGVEWDYVQWHENLSMDFLTVWAGVLFSFLLNNVYETVDGLAGHRLKISTLNIIGLVVAVGSTLLSIPLLFLTKRGTYDNLHPWISFIYPMSYLILRNSNHLMRKRISRFLCWVGSFSMEIYILYRHLFISSSTKEHGVIVYIPNSFWLNAIVSSLLLAWISYTMSQSLTGLCRWIIYSFFNISYSSSSLYNSLNNSSRSSLVHYDITGSVHFNSNGSNLTNPKDEPSTSTIDPSIMANPNQKPDDGREEDIEGKNISKEDMNETSLDHLLNNNSQEKITSMQDPNKEALKSIQYRWFGLLILLWIVNIL